MEETYILYDTDGTTPLDTVTVTDGFVTSEGQMNGKTVDDLLAAKYVLFQDMGAGIGGRRHKGSKKAHKKSRKGNKMLSSWVAFVKKVQHEEKISYSDAMKRASARKKEWKRGQMGGQSMPMKPDMSMADDNMSYADPDDELTYGGRRRRRTKRRGTKKRRGSRRRR